MYIETRQFRELKYYLDDEIWNGKVGSFTTFIRMSIRKIL
jgi:hypothetical protein